MRASTLSRADPGQQPFHHTERVCLLEDAIGPFGARCRSRRSRRPPDEPIRFVQLAVDVVDRHEARPLGDCPSFTIASSAQRAHHRIASLSPVAATARRLRHRGRRRRRRRADVVWDLRPAPAATRPRRRPMAVPSRTARGPARRRRRASRAIFSSAAPNSASLIVDFTRSIFGPAPRREWLRLMDDGEDAGPIGRAACVRVAMRQNPPASIGHRS